MADALRATLARIREAAGKVESERLAYRALVEQHNNLSGQKVGYVPRTPTLAVALDTYRALTDPTTLLALIAAVEAVMGERGTYVTPIPADATTGRTLVVEPKEPTPPAPEGT